MFKNRKEVSSGEGKPTGNIAAGAPAQRIEVGIMSDVGCHRELNEDCGRMVMPSDNDLLASKGRLAIVADGMGGHSAGEVASSIAVDVISKVYYDDPNDDATAALTNAFIEANRQIHAFSQESASLNGMGTTCTALVLKNGSAVAAHVGDSRLYLVRQNQIYLMTEDHSAVMELVKRGLLTLQDARHHPDKNVILRALGSHPEVDVTTWQQPMPVCEGDRFLLCSDGLYDLVEDDEIKEAVISASPRAACEQLVALARQRGGYDNITVAVLSLAESSPDVAPDQAPTGKLLPITREVEVEE